MVKKLILPVALLVCSAGCGYDTLTTTTTIAPLPFLSTVAGVAASDRIGYLHANAHELYADVTIGDGERLRELAEMAHVPDGNYRRFAAIVRDRRDELTPLLRNPDALASQRFYAIIDECAAAARNMPT